MNVYRKPKLADYYPISDEQDKKEYSERVSMLYFLQPNLYLVSVFHCFILVTFK